MNNEIIKFVNGDLELDVTVSLKDETVWLNRNQIAVLFGRDVKTIGKHINNALKEELDSSTVAKFATIQEKRPRILGLLVSERNWSSERLNNTYCYIF